MEKYRLNEKEYIEEIDSEAMRLVHEKSGARVLVLKNANPYKYFNITFMTPPHNSAGIPHIVEHCVLAGSRKYPLGSYDKLQQSLSVGYIGAATCNDHTQFSFMTKNDSDYAKGLDYILDSVFYPLVMEEEKIFMREGWRFEVIEGEEGQEFNLNGIVLNEMRACDGDYERRVGERICKRLMPDSVYHHRSGGKSYKIPRCSYEEIKEFHTKHYKASNAYIFIYGNVELDETLNILDVYLENNVGEETVKIPGTENIKKRIYKKERIHTNRREEHLYCYSCLFDGKLRPQQALAFDLMEEEIELVIETRLSEMGIKGAASCILAQSGIQDRFEVEFMTDVENAGKDIYKGIRGALFDIFDSDEGFRAQLMGKINRYELSFWEKMYKKDTAGEYLYDLASLYWFYIEDSVIDAFRVSDNTQYLKNRVWGDFYNTFITEELPKEGREILLECIPVNKGDNYFPERLQMEADKKLSAMTKEDLAGLKEKYADYEKWNKPNEEKNIVVGKSEDAIGNQITAAKVEYEKSELDGVTYYHIPIFQNKVVWLTLSFNADQYKDYISELQLLVSFINDRNFNDFYGLDTQEAKTLLTRYIKASVHIGQNYDEAEGYDRSYIRVDISAIVLEENIPDVIRMIHHMLFDIYVVIPGFDKKILNAIEQVQDNLFDYPEEYNTAIAGYSQDEIYRYQDQLDGLSYYRFLCALRDGGPDALSSFYSNCYAMLNRIFNNNNLSVFCSSTDRGLKLVKKAVSDKPFEKARADSFSRLDKDYKKSIRCTRDFDIRREYKKIKKYVLQNFMNESAEKWFTHVQPDGENPNIGIIIPSNVNYLSFYGRVPRYNYMGKFTGILKIATQILEDHYLRTELREQGGAYGYYVKSFNDGSVEITSARDPHIERTMKIILECADYLRNIPITEDELEIIKQSYVGIFLDSEKEDPFSKENIVKNIEIGHMNPDFDNVRLDSIKNCTLEDIRETADLIQQMLDNGAFCVFGSRQDIEECSDMFGYIERFDDMEDPEET